MCLRHSQRDNVYDYCNFGTVFASSLFRLDCFSGDSVFTDVNCFTFEAESWDLLPDLLRLLIIISSQAWLTEPLNIDVQNNRTSNIAHTQYIWYTIYSLLSISEYLWYTVSQMKDAFFHVARRKTLFAIWHGLFGLRDYLQYAWSLIWIGLFLQSAAAGEFLQDKHSTIGCSRTLCTAWVCVYITFDIRRHPQPLSLVWPRGLIALLCPK